MAIDLTGITKGKATKAPRIMIYGSHGMGKSTFGAQAPNPIFIQTEDGADNIDTSRFPLATKYEDVIESIGALYTQDHEYQTVVLDSLDWLESMIWKKLEKDYDEKQLAYGKGTAFAVDLMGNVLAGLNALRNDKGMIVILTAHCQIKRFDSPDVDSYERYMPKLQDKASAKVQEWCDAVLFCNLKTIIKKEDVGFNSKVSRGVTTGDRVLYTNEKPAYIAKNRYTLPDALPFALENSWGTLYDAITQKF